MAMHKKLTMINYDREVQLLLEWYLDLKIPAGHIYKVNVIETLIMQKPNFVYIGTCMSSKIASKDHTSRTESW